MDRSNKVKAGLLVAAILTGTVGITSGARADYQPSATDVVGVGAETLNYAMDFATDGDPSGGLGYNAANNANKLVVFDSTADANARNAYTTADVPSRPHSVLNPTVVLRAGDDAGAATDHQRGVVLCRCWPTQVRSTRSTSSRRSLCRPRPNRPPPPHNGWGFLHVVQIGSDPLQMIAANTTNAPAGLTDCTSLVKIYHGTYRHWNNIPATVAVRPRPSFR